jgi:hypothetical protein
MEQTVEIKGDVAKPRRICNGVPPSATPLDR